MGSVEDRTLAGDLLDKGVKGRFYCHNGNSDIKPEHVYRVDDIGYSFTDDQPNLKVFFLKEKRTTELEISACYFDTRAEETFEPEKSQILQLIEAASK